MHTNFSCYAQTDIFYITSYELHSSVGYTLRLGAQWQLQLLNYLVARMENTAWLWSHYIRIWPIFYTDIHGRQRQNKQMHLSKWRRSQWRLAALTCTDKFRRLTAETKSFCFFRSCMPVCRVVSC
jgi:hypothetical protein